MRAEAGQATVEWVGLLLVVGLVMGALGVLRAAPEERDLGRLVATRISGAAAGVASTRAVRPPAVRPPSLHSPTPPLPRGPAAPPPSSRARGADAVDHIRGIGDVAKRVWIVCLGYRRVLWELERPRMPGEVMSAREALGVANDCLNPYAFLGKQ